MKKRKRLFLIIPLIFVILIPLFIVFFISGYDTLKNVSYGNRAEEVVDIYIPRSAYRRESNGCVLFIHGGSWSSGDKKDKAWKCQMLANQGYVTASLSYSLFTEETTNTYDAWLVMEQISKALVKIEDVCRQEGVNITSCATAGYSAGAHLALLYAYSCKDAPLKVAFTASLAGPADFTEELWGSSYLGIAKILSSEEINDQTNKEELAEIMSSLSPVNYITSDAPPTLLAYGGKDQLVNAGNGQAVYDKCSEYGVKCDYLFLKHSSHYMVEDLHLRLKYDYLLGKYCKTYFGY